MPEGATVTEARRKRRGLQAAGRPVVKVELKASTTVHELALDYFQARAPLIAPSSSADDRGRLPPECRAALV